MAVEIAQLVLRGSFGPDQPAPEPQEPRRTFKPALERLRRDMLAEMRDMIEDALRRQQER